MYSLPLSNPVTAPTLELPPQEPQEKLTPTSPSGTANKKTVPPRGPADVCHHRDSLDLSL